MEIYQGVISEHIHTLSSFANLRRIYKCFTQFGYSWLNMPSHYS